LQRGKRYHSLINLSQKVLSPCASLISVPRTCIGQDFAYMEGKIILAVTLRKFDFTPMYDGTPFQLKAFTARPIEGMPMKLSWRDS